MTHYLTEVADYRKLLKKTDRLVGEKYGVKFSEDNFIYVSPAVYELAETDLDKVAASLMVREIEGKSWHQMTERR